MTGRKAIVGLCMLCALVLSAFAAQSASAATLGTTVFTCKEPTGTDVPVGPAFKVNSHCKETDKETGGKFRHVEVPENTTTEITGTTVNTAGESTPSILKSVQSGIEEELQSKLAHILPEVGGVKSWITNAKDPVTGEHYVHGELWVQFTEVSVAKPAEKGCKVKGGEVTTKKLKFTSKGQKAGEMMFIKFEPVEGTLFAEFTVEGCSIGALNGNYEVKGSVRGEPDGATLNFSHPTVTTENTLSLRGQKAGFESSTTVKATDIAKGDAVDTALSVTTVETP